MGALELETILKRVLCLAIMYMHMFIDIINLLLDEAVSHTMHLVGLAIF